MKPKCFTNKLFALCFGAMPVVLQSCLFLHGCSMSAGNTDKDFAQQSLYSSKCTSCHRLIEPQEHPPNVWREYVYKYGQAMSIHQQQRLIEYLQSKSGKASR